MSSLTDEVKGLFEPRGELFKLRKQAAQVLNQEEWKVFKKAAETFEGKRRFTKRQYEIDYSTRVDQERRRLIKDAGSVKRNLIFKRFGADGFNKDEINRRAHIAVRHAHEQDMARIDDRECGAIRTILENAKSRSVLREKPIIDFQKAVDRRSGKDRRERSRDR